MGDISKHFNRYEFACSCGCGQDTVDAELLRVLEDVRDVFGIVHISSGARCFTHNADVGGSPTSKHIVGKAADIQLPDSKPVVIADYLCDNYPDRYGIGLYDGWVHIDVRNKKVRWNG